MTKTAAEFHRKPAPWYEVTFDELYPLIYSHRDDASARREMDLVVRLLGLETRRDAPPARVLDVCCGGGRHAEALARRGLDVWGIDLSASLLDDARERKPLRGRLVQGDIRRLPFLAEFDVVLNLFTSFGYFADEADNRRALESMSRALRPGGALLIDHINRPVVERALVERDETRRADAVIRQRRWIDGNRVRKTIEVTGVDGRRVTLEEDVRLYRRDELETLLQECGLRNLRFFGAFDGATLRDDSSRMIAVAERPRP